MMYLVKILGFALLFTTAAQALTNFNNAPSGAHYAKGSGEPVCTLSGLTVTCTGTNIQGVGNTNVNILLTVDATFTGVCHNPGNENVIDQFTESGPTTTEAIASSSKNGRLDVPAQSATASSEQFLETFECPNPNWTPEVTDVEVTSFEYTVTFEGFDEPAITVSG
ncbi:hypothetical protein IWW34DRAFT_913817 [Fusarium oxysporum f. sp. albedinis]|nr:hypothetical protein IWW34DRAFT_913817 [Fusarium oxysporum f. sp. albedinis]KAJ0127434.1 hypothetical protein HZ326_29462 [Fusarium oxysporum f. sp. albedinis]KAK2474744.1 hypothetical protein H9L39_14704 [Fusarium oxysporum f. sp. albedinis]